MQRITQAFTTANVIESQNERWKTHPSWWKTESWSWADFSLFVPFLFHTICPKVSVLKFAQALQLRLDNPKAAANAFSAGHCM